MKLERIINALVDVMIDSTNGEPLLPDTRQKVRVLLADLLTIRNLQHEAQAGSKNKKALVEAVGFLQAVAQPACAAAESLTNAVAEAGAQAENGGG